MGIIIIFILVMILIGQGSIYVLHKKQLENDERIINRLNLLWKEINQNNNKDS
jgi:hypothetical protein